MECPSCGTENPDENRFCRACGAKFLMQCPRCKSEVHSEDKFCGKCGLELREHAETTPVAEPESIPSAAAPLSENIILPDPTSERKHVTVLFSDLTGYTAMSEKLDPEEVKEITGRIFGEVSQIIANYDGFVEKYAGDAVMAVFGVPRSHEDDPIRAIKAARQIHRLVDSISPEIERKIGRPVSMHTGINTGLVVTGEVDLQRGTHGIAGDTVNLASRLSSLAKPGEILIDSDTCLQVEGYFACEYLKEATVKGKADPVRIHKILAQREKPVTIHRLSGLRAELIGRKMELAELSEAVENLRAGKGRIFSICGDAGTGKSRLVEEFKATLNLDEIQWLEGHAYAHTQNTPYFPIMDLLNRAFKIEEADPPAKVREKVETGIKALVGGKNDIISYVGSLYGLNYPEIENVSPEFWKTSLHDAIKLIITAMARGAPTVFLLEDIHWADPSFIELLRHVCLDIRQPAIVLCVYRPTFNFFVSHQLTRIGKIYREIRVKDLSATETQHMLESLLKSDKIPMDLQRLVQDRVDGNPFYLEELVNSLIESETLVPDDVNWKLTKQISESEISSTIHGIITGRLDRLENDMKRVLQEASVIGRAFLHTIIKRITDLKDQFEDCIGGLERLDLIRMRSHEPEVEYIFKHALTQEVVYSGLLKKERRRIHERIGHVMEQLFHDRLNEFYETLAFHYRQGDSVEKAVEYLVKSGVKSLNRFSLEEAHQYYKEAYDLISSMVNKTEEDNNILFDLMEKWALVFYYYGRFRDLISLFSEHIKVAEHMRDKSRAGIFYAWLGMALWASGKMKDSYRYLRKALKLGEEAGNPKVIGYACAWLPLPCIEMGIMDEGIEYGERAKRIAEELPSDQYLYFKSRGDLGCLYYFRGDSVKALEAGREIIEYGEKNANIRSQAMGHAVMGWGYLASGDFESAVDSFCRVEDIAVDPFYATVYSCFRALAHFFVGQFQQAEKALERADKCLDAGFDYAEGLIKIVRGLLWIATGRFGRGINFLYAAKQIHLARGLQCCTALSEYILGKVYLGMALGEGDITLSAMFKNLFFLVKTIPFANHRAECHLRKAIALYSEIGARGALALALFDLGKLHKAKGRIEQARKQISEAIKLFEECGTEIYLNQARNALESTHHQIG